MRLPLVAAAAAGVQVGAAIVASRFVVAEVPPLTLALLRYAIALLCLLPFIFKCFIAETKVSHALFAPKLIVKDALAIAGLGVGQFALLVALLNWGLQTVGAAQAALIFSLFPLLTLLLSAALGRERITPTLVGGVMLSIAGVALSIAPKFGAGAAAHSWRGELAVLASAGVGAVCSVMYRPYLRRYPTLPVSAGAMLASVLSLALLALPEHWPTRVAALGAATWSVVAFIGLSSGAGYVAWLYALKHETPTRVTVFLALNPVTAALLGTLFLHEALDDWTLSAIACIGAGLWLATRRASAPPQGSRRT
ncbi:MAG: DMT family transporter [Burkholderiaceae bacterium]|nr:DMT family transporter [Burkholderiales bacterium]TAL66221.1 MAG: DMT family transporter [Burkholderiaceae bacterium]TBR74908.1 MAG: DMT family transporter [Burkholderiaceae bacterium]